MGSAPKKILVFGFTLGVFCIWHAMMLRSALFQLENNARELVYEQAMAYITANVPAGFSIKNTKLTKSRADFKL
jgi:hypothetical protein